MRAFVVENAGGPFVATNIATQKPMSGEVSIRVLASGVNPLDIKIRAAQAAHAKHPLPAVLGLDVAGIVEEIGADVTAFRPGDEVYGMVGGVGGIPGTLADFVLADADLIAPKPATLSMRQAASLPLVAITAWEGLIDRARVHTGQRVLVHAGAGGVGYIAMQMALAFGADVFATVSAEKKHIVEATGAKAIDYRAMSAGDYMAAYTDGLGFDIVYDTVGGSTLDASFATVKRYAGHVVSCLGWGAHSLAPLSFRAATYSGVFTLLPLLTGIGRANHGSILRQTAALVDAGKLVPLLNVRTFGANDIAEAYALVAAGTLGKVVVDFERA